MNSRIRLSICIPTYNRADKLDFLLESIFRDSASGNIEVVISDNSSTDNTHCIVEKWMKVVKNIIYVRNEKNMGFDYNLYQSINKSNGDYVWVIGDDDAITDCAITRVLDSIEKFKSQLFILSGYYCNQKMEIMYKRQVLRNSGSQQTFVLKDAKSFSCYVDEVNNDISFLFAFITSFVLDKSIWKETIPSYLKNSNYDHVYELMNSIKTIYELKVLNEMFFYSRSSPNQHKSFKGQHFLLDLDSYRKFTENVFSDDENHNLLKRSLGKLMLRQHKFKSIVNYYHEFKTRKQTSSLNDHFKYFRVNKFIVLTIKVLNLKPIYKILSKIYYQRRKEL